MMVTARLVVFRKIMATRFGREDIREESQMQNLHGMIKGNKI